VGLVTGSAGSEIYRVAAEGIDTFITGEAPHWVAVAAEELGMNLFLGGHYATETFGVKALAAHLSKRFKIPWTFIDFPTGLSWLFECRICCAICLRKARSPPRSSRRSPARLLRKVTRRPGDWRTKSRRSRQFL